MFPDIPIGTAISIFAVAFGAWAWVVHWGVRVIREEVASLKAQVEAAAEAAHEATIATEHRMTRIEAEFRTFARMNHPHFGLGEK
jgi:hypothetical protein